MFFRIKRVGGHQYLQLVENKRVSGTVRQCVLASLGRVDCLAAADAGEIGPSLRDNRCRLAIAKAIARAFSQVPGTARVSAKDLPRKTRSNTNSQTA